MLRSPSVSVLLSSGEFRAAASCPSFLAEYRSLDTSSLLLGIFASVDAGLRVFRPAANVFSDSHLANAATKGDFVLSRIKNLPQWRLRGCRDGRLLLASGRSLAIYDPLSRAGVVVRRSPDDPFPDAYLDHCLLQGGRDRDHGAAAAAAAAEGLRVVSVQWHGDHGMRAAEYDFEEEKWQFYPWEKRCLHWMKKKPQQGGAMPTSGRIFWKLHNGCSARAR
ncbi:hypothetical protein ACP4OV_023092 [Aristida adscensionis]